MCHQLHVFLIEIVRPSSQNFLLGCLGISGILILLVISFVNLCSLQDVHFEMDEWKVNVFIIITFLFIFFVLF